MTLAPNRRWSFSLRTLFVVVTVLAALAGLLALVLRNVVVTIPWL